MGQDAAIAARLAAIRRTRKIWILSNSYVAGWSRFSSTFHSVQHEQRLQTLEKWLQDAFARQVQHLVRNEGERVVEGDAPGARSSEILIVNDIADSARKTKRTS